MDKIKAYHHRPPFAVTRKEKAAQEEGEGGRETPGAPRRCNTVKLPAHREAAASSAASGNKPSGK